MNAIRVEMAIEKDGELLISDLPCRKGDRFEAIVLLPDASSETARQAALDRYLARAQASRFKSTGPYPTREERHHRGAQTPSS